MTDNPTPDRLVLASQSPVRAELLRNAGLAFQTLSAHVDEAGLIARNRGKNPEDLALSLATAKAQASPVSANDLVIAADQLLVLKGTVLQKPIDMAAARQRLCDLAGKTHQLVTGAVLALQGEIVFEHVSVAHLTMHALSDTEIDQTLALDGQTVLQSVGAYRLEGPGISLFAALEGDYFAMLGLPLVPLLAAIRRHARHLLPGAAVK